MDGSPPGRPDPDGEPPWRLTRCTTDQFRDYVEHYPRRLIPIQTTDLGCVATSFSDPTLMLNGDPIVAMETTEPGGPGYMGIWRWPPDMRVRLRAGFGRMAPEQLAEFGDCVGIVVSTPELTGPLPLTAVMWLPSGLRYAYTSAFLEVAP